MSLTQCLRFQDKYYTIKHAWLTDNNKNHSCFKESTNNGDGTPLPYWWILHTAQLLLSDCHLSVNRFYAHSGMPWTVPFQQHYFLTNIISLSKFRTTFVLRCLFVRMKKHYVLSYPLSTQRKLWSDWADAQADPSLRWAHTGHFVGFVMLRLMCQKA